MKILVCISSVPDTTTKIAFTNGDTEFNAAGVQFIINPYDEWYALVRAIELKEKKSRRLRAPGLRIKRFFFQISLPSRTD